MSAPQDAPDASEPEMAGWLWRKWKRGGMRRKWVREYVVLRGSFLYTYATEEQKKQQQLLPVKDATTQIYVHHKRLFTFEIVHDERRGVCFDAPSDEEKYEWIRLIARAAVGPVNAPKTVNTYYEVLNLRKEAGQEVTENEVRKAYRKLALRHHPDKGGDIALFQRITEAYEILCALAEQAAEEAEDFVQVHASLRRGGEGGMGCSLKGTGKPPLARISVKAVKPDSQAEAAGLLAGDIIIEVDGRGVRGLPFPDTLKYMQGIQSGPELLELLALRSKAEAIAPPSRSPPPVPEPEPEPNPEPEAGTASAAERPARPPPAAPTDAGSESDSAGASKPNAEEAPANVAGGASQPQSGWLLRKWKSGGFRRRWEKCFFVVQDGYLVSYNSANTASAKPTGLMPLKDATTQLFKHHSREHTFEVLHEERRPVCFACADDEDLHSWVKAVATASLGPANPPAGRSVADLCGVLGIGELDSADLDVIRAAYRECALHHHPEKGGDGAKWQAITEAYEVLVALRETEFQELEEYNAIKVALDRPPAGGSLGMHLVPTGKAPICRVSVKQLVEGTVSQTCGLIEAGDIVVEVDDISVRGVAFEEVLRRMRGAGARRILIKLLRRKPAAQLQSPSHGTHMLPAPAQNAASRGRKASFMQAVNAEMSGQSVSPARGAESSAAAGSTACGRRKMSWLQRVEQQKASVSPGLSAVTEADEDEDESDESDGDQFDEQDADTEDDESADAAMPLRATPSQPAVPASGRRKMSFLQQVENEVKTGTAASAPAAAPLAPAAGGAGGRRKASWLVRAASEQSAPAPSRKTSWLHKSAAAELSSTAEDSAAVVFEEFLDDDETDGGSGAGTPATTAASAARTGLRKGSWMPQSIATVPDAQIASAPTTAAALSSIGESEDDESNDEDEDSDDSERGVDAEEANEALNRLASMHGIPQRASWVDVPAQPTPQPLQQPSQQQQQNASSGKKPTRNLRINADVGAGADPFPSLGTPSPSVGNSSPWSEQKPEPSELSWRLLWSRRFRLLYVLCRINSRGAQAQAGQDSSTLEAIRAVLNNIEDACTVADGAPICAALHSQKVSLWRDAKLRRSGATSGPIGADGNEFAAALVHIDEPFAESRAEHAGLVHDVVPPNSNDVVRLRSGDGPSRVRFTAEMQRMIGAQPDKPTLDFLQRCRQLGLLIDLFCVQHGM